MTIPEPPELRRDREGRWWYRGVEVSHPGIARFLDGAVTGGAEDEYRVRHRDAELPVAVEGTAWHVVRLEVEADSGLAWVHLSDGSREPLATETVCFEGDVPRCQVKDGAWAAFSRRAAQTLAMHIEEEDGRPILRLGPPPGTYLE